MMGFTCLPAQKEVVHPQTANLLRRKLIHSESPARGSGLPGVHSQPAAGGRRLHISLCPRAPPSIFLVSSGHNPHTHFLRPSSQQRPSLCSGWRAPSSFFLPFPFPFPGSCCLSSPWAPSSHSPLRPSVWFQRAPPGRRSLPWRLRGRLFPSLARL